MTIRGKKFTPEILLSAPRRSSAAPSADGKYALYSQSSYSFDSHSTTSEIRVLDIATGHSTLLSNDIKASEPRWLGDGYEVVWLKEGENGNTSFVVCDALENGWTYVAATVPGPLSSLKLYNIDPGMIAVAVVGRANPDDSLHNPKDVVKSHSSARVYDSLFTRHWDRWIGESQNTIWTAVLQRSAPHVYPGRKGRYRLVGFKNALKGSNLESPIPTDGGTNHFDIGREGLVFVARDPELVPATHTRCYAYFLPRTDLMNFDVSNPIRLIVPGLEGWATSPAFSPDGKKICVLFQKLDGYESDKNRIAVFLNIFGGDVRCKSAEGFELLQSDDEKGFWDRSPSSVSWSVDGSSLLAQAEDMGRVCLFEIPFDPPSTPGHKPVKPRKLTSKGSISDVVPAAAKSDKLFISATSLVDSSIYYILDPARPENITLVSSATRCGSAFGLAESQVSSISWHGANDDVHAWMVKPSFFRKGRKYPLACLVHGGPQGAWTDSWSTRWNPAVFAEQGYVVVAPNPTGSTGYGQDFTDAIKNEWGGLPYEDLVKGFEYIEAEIDFIDTDRAVALGASYGGYMMNWIQGHNLGRKFKALVCHDGVFSMTAQCASDEQYFPLHDLGGAIWERQELWDKWDPSRFTKNWDTPQLVIHSSLDYRLTIAEGLAAFNILQMRGVESMFLNFPDENHFVLKPENSLVWHRTVINFINQAVDLPLLLDAEGKNGLNCWRQSSLGVSGLRRSQY